MAKGQYKKRKRASKYEEKVAIDASFEDVIKIALNMQPSIMPIAEAKRFVFEKWNVGKYKFELNKDLKQLIEKYSFSFDKILVSKIRVKVSVVSPELKQPSQNAVSLNIQILAADIINKNPLKVGNTISQAELLDVSPSMNMIKQEEYFSITADNFECNTILVYCDFTGDKFPEKIALLFQIFKKESD